MATLKIWETTRSPSALQLIRLSESTAYQAVAFTGTAGTSAAFDSDTTVISVQADAACAVRVGAAPVAVATDFPLAANTMYDFAVQPGEKISAITT
jgi:hypothetical protein